MSLVGFGIRKPVAVNLVMFALLGAGLMLGLGLRREFFPDVAPSRVMVVAPYPSASPEEIEDSLAIKIEDRIADLRNVKEINTTVTEGAASVLIEFAGNVDIESAVAEVKREIDALQDLPEEAERIFVEDFEAVIPVISLTAFGDVDERTLKDLVNEMREDLRSLQGMGDVQLSGVRTDEIRVEVSESKLIEYRISLPQVSDRVRNAMQELPGGTVRTATGNVAVRTMGAEEKAEDVRRIVVQQGPSGRPIRLEEIAKVTEGFADVDLQTRFNGERCVSLTVYALGKEDVIKIATLVKAYAAGRTRATLDVHIGEKFTGQRPDLENAYELGRSRPVLPGLSMQTHNDLARLVSQRLELLSRNALWGGLLVFATLLLLLAPRVALWVTSGLITALAGTLAVMYMLDISLNFLTMFGLIVVLGLIVDDAIVVAENIAAKHEAGDSALQAAERGARQVAWPVTVTVMTTICAFMPLRMVKGDLGDLLAVLPLIVACSLTVSLLECLLILPSHMGHSLLRADRRGKGKRSRVGAAMERARTNLLEKKITPRYLKLLSFCLRRRYLTLTAAIAIFVGTAGLVGGERVNFTFMTSADSETVVIDVTMPVGSTLAQTDMIVKQIEHVVSETSEIQSVFSLVGARTDVMTGGTDSQSHLGQVLIELRPVEERDRTSRQVIDGIRKAVGNPPGVKSIRYQEITGGPAGADITFAVLGDSVEQVNDVVARLKHLISLQEGVVTVSDNGDAGQRELRIELRDGARELGFTTAGVARQLRAAVFGLEAHTFAGNREDVDVRIMLDEHSRRSLAAIESMHVFSPAGHPVPLREVASITEARGYATVRRLNRERAVTVSGDIDRGVTSPEKVVGTIAAEIETLAQQSRNVRIVARGQQKDMAEAFSTLPRGMLAAAVMIYVLLAWLFSSYLQPLVILGVVPFSFAGIVWGHLLLGFEMTFLSLIGLVALTGIVVNDSLIFMEFFNHRQKEGMPVFDALVATGKGRLRAILLTTMTTVLGLSPLMLEQSFQARFLIPMAITISFGLIAATGVTLLVLPCVLMIGQDLRRAARWVLTGNAEPMNHALSLDAMAPEHTSELPPSDDDQF